MYRDYSGSSHDFENAQQQVIVKLKRTPPARRVTKAVAFDGAERDKKGALERWLKSGKLASMSPVFGQAPKRGVANFRRMAMAAEDEVDRDLSGINVLSLGTTRDAKKACQEIVKDPLVEFAYIPPVKYVLPASGQTQDPLLNRQWGLRAIDLFRAEQYASFKPAKDIVIAVIDSGVDAGHPDLQGVLAEDRSFTSGAARDTSGHGTHVSGIIAAVRNNSIGIRGVTNSTRVLSLKALNPYSATGYYQAIRHATENAQVINFSLGGGHDPTEELLVRRAIRKGVVVVAAMGNEKQEGNPRSYPAAIKDVIGVGASDESDRIAEFSNTGTHIDLVAPGVNILSTVPTYPSSLAQKTDYEAWPGTSMAAPMVSAAAALLLAKRPDATPAQVRRALVRSADKVPGQTKFDTTHGHGRLNIRSALKLM